MTARRALVVPLVVAAALLGCKKKPAAETDEPPPNSSAPATPAARVKAALDGMVAEIEQDKAPSFGSLAGERLPFGHQGVVALDATAGRPEVDAAFGRFWAAWESWPDRIRRQLARQRAEQLTKQGVPPDRAAEQAEQAFRPLPPLRVTTPNPDLDKAGFNRIEADVAGGVRGNWSQNGGLSVGGTVEFSELLTLHCNGDLTARLRGRVGRLELHANGGLAADLADLQAPVVEARPNGNLFLRVGPGTEVLKLDGNPVTATVFVRGNPGLKVQGNDNRTRVLISY